MEQIKNLIKQFYPLLVVFYCVLFAVHIFFSVGNEEEKGVFENAGAVYVPMMEEEEVKNKGMEYIGNSADDYVPLLKYNAGAKSVGDVIPFKAQFLAQMKDGSFVDASTEDGFALYLVDIKNQDGYSVLERISSSDSDFEEIPAAFVYDKENDFLYIYGSGTFCVEVKVYGKGGATQTYEFNLPVEIS